MARTTNLKVAVLGSTGMLGSMVTRFLASQPEYKLATPPRFFLDATRTSLYEIKKILRGHNYVINCIGIIKPRINEQESDSVQCAIEVNSLFPHLLAAAAERVGCRVLQIATDCVYSGQTGSYTESSPHDALDVYGKTKSLGEVRSPAARHLRCSIIGPEGEGRPKDSLLEWFLSHPRGATVKGFTNHRWNGITTLAFAKICHGIMRDRLWKVLPAIQHVVPYNSVTKAELLSHFAYFYHREDASIGEVVAQTPVDRTLSTLVTALNEELWQAAGYGKPPCIQQMVEELVAYR
jgi:dTDP-4-dehydrorhamnose reductase